MVTFLISPANTRGRRAERLQEAAFGTPGGSPGSGSVARRLADGELTFAELFGAISSLYFRGKLAYALRFGSAAAVFVIAPGVGLVPPHYRVTSRRWQLLRATGTNVGDGPFRRTLQRSCRRLRTSRDGEETYVFLGSVAADRYFGVLLPELGSRLVVPREFLGIGSMQRGALLRRRVEEGRALSYVPAESVAATVA